MYNHRLSETTTAKAMAIAWAAFYLTTTNLDAKEGCFGSVFQRHLSSKENYGGQS